MWLSRRISLSLSGLIHWQKWFWFKVSSDRTRLVALIKLLSVQILSNINIRYFHLITFMQCYSSLRTSQLPIRKERYLWFFWQRNVLCCLFGVYNFTSLATDDVGLRRLTPAFPSSHYSGQIQVGSIHCLSRYNLWTCTGSHRKIETLRRDHPKGENYPLWSQSP